MVAALADDGALRSRVSLYLHPLAGRPIVWHVVWSLLEVSPAPDEIRVLHRASSGLAVPEGLGDRVRVQAVEADSRGRWLRAALTSPGLKVLVDGAAPLVTPPTVARLLRAGEGGLAVLEGCENGARIAVGGEGPALASADDPLQPSGALRIAATSPEELIRITDRHSLSSAAVAIRDRLVRAHEGRGVSFILPATTWIDTDVRIGADTVIYPGAVLEGSTDIGGECVIGPYSRIVDSTIGKGVELKGWNFVTHTHVRNHAVLEPHVRRGFD